MKMKKLIAVLMVAALLFTTASCGGGDNGGGGEAKDSLTIGIDADAVALDPLRINDTLTMSILSNVYEPLVKSFLRWQKNGKFPMMDWCIRSQSERTQLSTMEIQLQQKM